MSAIRIEMPPQIYIRENHACDQENIKDIAIGAISAAVVLPAIQFSFNRIVEWMKSAKFDLNQSQEVVQLWVAIGRISSPILRTAAKATFAFYVVILGPILEEVIFRGAVNTFLKTHFADNPVLLHTISGIIFGACHLSPFQGWMNLPIFIVTGLMGIYFSILSETTGNLKAPATAHILNNGWAVAELIAQKV